jgi:hypothetical protein
MRGLLSMWLTFSAHACFDVVVVCILYACILSTGGQFRLLRVTSSNMVLFLVSSLVMLEYCFFGMFQLLPGKFPMLLVCASVSILYFYW